VRKMAGTGRPEKDYKDWKCKECGCNIKDHYKEYCGKCYRRIHSKEKYATDIVFRERMKAKNRVSSLKNYLKNMQEDPTWSARKQKEFRNKHPDTFNRAMCRFYYRRMGLEARAKLIKEVEAEERCVMCGDTGFFKIGSGQTATLNGKDCTGLIEAHYKKGQWLCEDCLFK